MIVSWLSQLGPVGVVADREAAAQVEQFQPDPVDGQRGHDAGALADRAVPGRRVHHLRPDVEGQPVRPQAERDGEPGQARYLARRHPELTLVTNGAAGTPG